MQSKFDSSWIEEYESRLKEYYQYCEENGRVAICLCKRCEGKEIHPVKLEEEEEDGRLKNEKVSKTDNKEQR